MLPVHLELELCPRLGSHALKAHLLSFTRGVLPSRCIKQAVSRDSL